MTLERDDNGLPISSHGAQLGLLLRMSHHFKSPRYGFNSVTNYYEMVLTRDGLEDLGVPAKTATEELGLKVFKFVPGGIMTPSFCFALTEEELKVAISKRKEKLEEQDKAILDIHLQYFAHLPLSEAAVALLAYFRCKENQNFTNEPGDIALNSLSGISANTIQAFFKNAFNDAPANFTEDETAALEVTEQFYDQLDLIDSTATTEFSTNDYETRQTLGTVKSTTENTRKNALHYFADSQKTETTNATFMQNTKNDLDTLVEVTQNDKVLVAAKNAALIIGTGIIPGLIAVGIKGAITKAKTGHAKFLFFTDSKTSSVVDEIRIRPNVAAAG